MSNFTQILSRPIKSGCNFNALNPIVYRFQREDANFDIAQDNSGSMEVRIPLLDMVSYYEVGDSVYIEGLGLAEITAVTLFAGSTYVTVDLPYTGTAVGYINNLSKRGDYKLEVGVYDSDTDEVLAPVISVDYNQAGEAFVDISGVMTAYLRAEWNNPSVADPEPETSRRVYIKYQEFYDSTYWEQIDDSANPIVPVFGYIPLILGSIPIFTRYPHGGNLLMFMPGAPAPKWLTRFTKMSIWRGYPFTVSALFPIASIDMESNQYNEAGALVSGGIITIAATPGDVVRINLEYLVASAVKKVIRLLSGVDTLLPEMEITVKDPCNNPVYLFWKNSLGGDSFWMFDETQDYEFTYPSGRKVKRLVLFADNLRVDEWDALNELNSPSQVIASNIVDFEMSNTVDKTHFRNDNQVYVVSPGGEKLGVIVIAEESKTRSVQRKHAIDITIELPEFYTV